MKIYTLTGDDGSTSLSGGRRVPKHSLRVEAYGSVEELTSWVGLLRDAINEHEIKEMLLSIQDNLMKCEAALAADKENSNVIVKTPCEDSITKLEAGIDRMQTDLPLLKHFIIPGGNITVSYCHIARTVCRRAERAVLRLKNDEFVPDVINKYLNRLSDYLFVLARTIAYRTDCQNIKWPLE